MASHAKAYPNLVSLPFSCLISFQKISTLRQAIVSLVYGSPDRLQRG